MQDLTLSSHVAPVSWFLYLKNMNTKRTCLPHGSEAETPECTGSAQHSACHKVSAMMMMMMMMTTMIEPVRGATWLCGPLWNTVALQAPGKAESPVWLGKDINGTGRYTHKHPQAGCFLYIRVR